MTAKNRSDSIGTAVAWANEICYARELGDLIDIYMRQKKLAEAIPLSQKLLATYHSIPGNDHDRDSLPSALLTMGICYSADSYTTKLKQETSPSTVPR